MKKFFFLISIVVSLFSVSYSIEVGGHITENTVWSPEGNPYHVVHDIIVDEDVTLTILPGTEVKFNAAPLVDETSFNNYFVYYNGTNVAKMLLVDGRIIANGTEQAPIIFTRFQDSLYYHWGIIYLREEADLSSFKYCNFYNSALMLIVLGIIPRGAISIYNEGAIIKNCNFIDNLCGIFNDRPVERLEIIDNSFYNIDYICPNYTLYNAGAIKIDNGAPSNFNSILIAGNSFMETGVSPHVDLRNEDIPAYVVNNFFVGESGIHANMETEFGSYIYNNEFINCEGTHGAIFGGEEGNALYIKNNNFIEARAGIDLNHGYAEISDNYFEGCRLILSGTSSSKVINNIIVNNPEPSSNPAISGNVDIITNNIITNCGVGFSGSGETQFSNNIFINNNTICSFLTDISVIENQIIICNDEIFLHTPSVNGYPIFRNCILDFELPEGCIDGGGNIWVDSLQAQTLFDDIQNGDFHLIEGSLAIDAGFNTPYYHPFDMDYNQRVWDGNNNGQPRIDIGPYEYGAPALGGIEGYTFNPTNNGEPIDYVLIKINNEPGEFTFSDSIGNFEYKLPAGVYDVYAERVFYDNVIEYQVEVFDEQFTQLDIPMLETVDVDEPIIPNSSSDIINLSNYPNPFNPETTITFNLPEPSRIDIVIFNIRGQRVKTFIINSLTDHSVNSVTWNGTDENNKPVASGIYLYQLIYDNKPLINNKMLLLK